MSRKPYGLASDIWSLGCMIYTLLVGAAPFESKVVKSTLERVSRAAYIIPEHLSPEAKSIIREMLQKDPKHRITLKDLTERPFFTLPSAPLVQDRSSAVDNSRLPTINTKRLRPISKQTKHALISITEDGRIQMEFNGDKYRMEVSGDGAVVKFYEASRGVTAEALRTYKRSGLPQKFWKKYGYCAKFVDAVRAKTPKVLL